MKALLVFDGREDFRQPERTIFDDGLIHCDSIDIDGLNRRLQGAGLAHPDVVLLDSTWPAARLLKAAMRVRAAMPNVLVLLLPDVCRDFVNPLSDETGGGRDRHMCAIHGTSMVKAVRIALRRQEAQQKLLHIALKDELTGLYNRRAFRALATQGLRVANRLQRSLLLFFADLDDLKGINDRFGHREGDRALARAAAGIKATFNDKSDIVARIGGDEFIAVAIEEPGRGEQELCQALRRSVRARGAREGRYALSLSVGVARFDPASPRTLSELMGEADIALYRHKRAVACGPPALPTGPIMVGASSL